MKLKNVLKRLHKGKFVTCPALHPQSIYILKQQGFIVEIFYTFLGDTYFNVYPKQGICYA